MPTPGHVEGLLSPEDVGSARRSGLLSMSASLLSPGSSLADGLGAARGTYAGQMDSTMKLKDAATTRQERAAEQQSKQAQAAKLAELQQRYPITPNMTGAQIREMGLAYAAAGLTPPGGLDGISKLMPKEAEPYTLNAGDVRFGPDGKQIASVPHAPQQSSGIDDQRLFTRENTLAGNFNKETQPMRELVQTVLAPAVRTAALAKRGDGPAQIALLYSFVRALDPNSVVREGEVALVRSGASLRQQAQAMYDKYLKGEAVVVPEGMIDQMAELINQRASSMESYVADRQRYWEGRAARAGIRNTDGLFEEVGRSTSPQEAAPAGPPVAQPQSSNWNQILGQRSGGGLMGGFGATPGYVPNAQRPPERRNRMLP